MQSLKILVDGKSYPIEEQCILGREDGCTIILTDPHVSRKHAAIQRAPDGSHILFDLNSSRGTFLDGERIVSAVIKAGSTAKIGQSTLTFEATGVKAAPRTAGKSFRPGSAVDGMNDLRRDYDHLRAAYQLTHAIGLEQDPDRMMTSILEASFELLPAERVAIVLIDQNSKRPTKQVARSRTGSDEEVIVSRTLLAEVVNGKVGVISADAGADARFSRSESICIDGVRSAMCVPLAYEDEVLGVMHADSLHAINAFRKNDLELFSSIAAQAALVLKKLELRNRMNAMLEEERNRLERLLAELPAGVLLFDANHKLVKANQAGSGLLSRLGGQSIPELMRRASRGSFEIETGEEPKLICLISGSHLGGPENQFVLVIQDVTKERMRERHSAHADRLAMVGQLTGSIAHDFNNLLSVILSLGTVLHEDLTDPELKDCAKNILQAADRGGKVIKQLMVFSRRDPLKPKVIDANVVIDEMQSLLESAVRGQAELSLDLAQRPQPIVMDQISLEQILMNLVSNARDAVSYGGKIQVATSELVLQQTAQRGLQQIPAGRWLQLVVSDDGCGMTSEIADRIFEPFFTTKEPGVGTGLGLSTVYGLVKRGGGWIWVDSKPGAGARFHLCFPYADSAEPSSPIRHDSQKKVMR